MSLDLTGILTTITDHALASGHFTAVNAHEPASPPATGGLTAAVWIQDIGPLPRASGLASTTTRVELTVRVYSPALMEPRDDMDPAMVAAVDALLAAYTGDFTLGARIRNIDILGAYGEPLRARAGYLRQAGTAYRVMDITLPAVVNDLYDQAP
jgi:hypothetical protein